MSGSFLKVPLGCLSTWNDGLENHFILRLHERRQVGVAPDVHYENPLPSVSILVRVLQNVQHVAAFNMKYNLLEGNPAPRSQPLVFLNVPREVLHDLSLAQYVP